MGRSRAMPVLLAALACGCGSVAAQSPRSARAEVRAVAQRYMADMRRGDGAAACRLMSRSAMRADGYRTLAACARDHSAGRGLPRFHVVRVNLASAGRAFAVIGDASVSDSGNDALALRRYGSRWLIDAD